MRQGERGRKNDRKKRRKGQNGKKKIQAIKQRTAPHCETAATKDPDDSLQAQAIPASSNTSQDASWRYPVGVGEWRDSEGQSPTAASVADEMTPPELGALPVSFSPSPLDEENEEEEPGTPRAEGGEGAQ